MRGRNKGRERKEDETARQAERESKSEVVGTAIEKLRH